MEIAVTGRTTRRRPSPAARRSLTRELLAGFFHVEVGQSRLRCLELLSLLDEIRSGDLSFWQGRGEAHTLVLTPRRALLHHRDVDPSQASCELPLETLEEAARVWLKNLDGQLGRPLLRSPATAVQAG